MILEFPLFQSYSDKLIHGITTKVMDSFGIGSAIPNPPDDVRPIYLNQVHGDKIISVSERPTGIMEGDALITQTVGLPLAVRVADCQAVLFFDSATGTVAVTHSGWRGSAANIIGKTIERMTVDYGVRPSDVLVGISPSLGPCCARFTDPKSELPESVWPYIKNNHVDFWSLSADQVVQAGVPENQIEIMGICTRCRHDLCFSHRRGEAGRIAAFISLK